MLTKIPFPEDYEKLFGSYDKRTKVFYENFYEWLIQQLYPSHELLYGDRLLVVSGKVLQVTSVFMEDALAEKLSKLNKKKNKLTKAQAAMEDLCWGPSFLDSYNFKQHKIEVESGYIYIDEDKLWG